MSVDIPYMNPMGMVYGYVGMSQNDSETVTFLSALLNDLPTLIRNQNEISEPLR